MTAMDIHELLAERAGSACVLKNGRTLCFEDGLEVTLPLSAPSRIGQIHHAPEGETSTAKVYPTLRWFECSHLSGPQRSVARLHQELAIEMAGALNDSPSQAEVHAGLRHLLEAKDCFARAALP